MSRERCSTRSVAQCQPVTVDVHCSALSHCKLRLKKKEEKKKVPHTSQPSPSWVCNHSAGKAASPSSFPSPRCPLDNAGHKQSAHTNAEKGLETRRRIFLDDIQEIIENQFMQRYLYYCGQHQ